MSAIPLYEKAFFRCNIVTHALKRNTISMEEMLTLKMSETSIMKCIALNDKR